MTNAIVLSIVTPVLNGKDFIESCLENVISQGCDCCEHLIIDGGSTDGTTDIIKDYASRYGHIRWISEKDSGQSEAMNKGVRLARGKILGFLNFDDYYESGVFARVIKIFASLSKPSLVVGKCHVWNADKTLVYVHAPRKLNLTHLLLKPEMYIHPVNPSAYFYHRSLHQRIGYYDINDHYAMDLDFLIRAVQAVRVVTVDDIWGNMRLTPASKTCIQEKENRLAAIIESTRSRHRRRLPFMKKTWIYLRIYCDPAFAAFRRVKAFVRAGIAEAMHKLK